MKPNNVLCANIIESVRYFIPHKYAVNVYSEIFLSFMDENIELDLEDIISFFGTEEEDKELVEILEEAYDLAVITYDCDNAGGSDNIEFMSN